MKGHVISKVFLITLCLWSCQANEEPETRGGRSKRFLYYSKKKGFGFGFGLGTGPKGNDPGEVPAMTMVGLVEQPVPVHVGVPEYPAYPPPAYPPPLAYSPPSYVPPSPPAYPPPAYAPPAYASPVYAPPVYAPSAYEPPAYAPAPPAYAPSPAY